MRFLIFPVLVGLLLASCAQKTEAPELASSKQMTFLSPGMNKQQVLTILGLPESTTAPEPTTEILNYKLATATRNGSELKDYIVILKNGFVAQYGKPRNGTKIINGVRIYEVE